MPWPDNLARRSHDPGFLWRVAIGIVAAGFIVSLLVRWLPGERAGDPMVRALLQASSSPQDPWAVVRQMLAEPNLSYYDILHSAWMIGAVYDPPPPADLFDTAAGAWGQEAADVGNELALSIADKEPTPDLRRIAAVRPPVPYANYALALSLPEATDPQEAYDALRVEGDLPNAEPARQMLVDELIANDRWDELTELAGAPDYRSLIPYYAMASRAAERGDWLTVLRLSPHTLVHRLETGPAVLAGFTGLCWLAFLLHAGRFREGGVSWLLCIVAVALGACSIPLTHFFIYYQEYGWGLEASNELLPGLKYYILGVGLREELAKLILMLPVIPVLVYKRSELQALFVCACVGLGFAIVENIGYFGGDLGTSSIGRLTTANFMHMSLTGLVGLALCRACWHPKSLGPEAVAVFCVAAILHGLYDAFIALPALSTDWDIIGSFIFLAMVFQFFREFRAANHNQTYRLSVSFTFTVGVALVTSATYVYLSSQVGQMMALRLLTMDLVGSAVMVYLFLREAPESLIDA